MTPVFEEGNLDSSRRPGETDWAVGHFVTGARHSDHVGVKWALHDEYSLASKPWSACLRATTLAVLISGKFRIDFCRVPALGRHTVTLSDPGDFVLFGPGIPHKSESLENGSRFLTVRWPSLTIADTMTFGLHQPTDRDLERLVAAMASAATGG